MAEWYTSPYKLGPPVAVPGFPRPLYPPDAADNGKTPSVDGPDVEAYKRTVWRAGRWQGPASRFDRAYSNGFSHGRSGNVGETGVAGVQRQQGINDTGWVGKASFDLFCRLLCPPGPHEGETAMDVNAANLIAQAYDLYGGKEPAPPPVNAKSKREVAFAASLRWLGYKESPANSNDTEFGAWYGMNYQPWCAMFCSYCYEVEAGGHPSFAKGVNYAYCPYIVSDARNNRNGLSVTNSPIRGDLVLFDWSFDGTYDHIGFFEGWAQNSGSFTAIEGNTSTSDNSNGGEVMRRTRAVSAQGTVFVRVAEP